MSSSSPFMRTGGKSWLRLREVTACVVLLWLNETRLFSPHSITVKSLVRREGEKQCSFPVCDLHYPSVCYNVTFISGRRTVNISFLEGQPLDLPMIHALTIFRR